MYRLLRLKLKETEIYRYEGVHDTGYYFLDTQVLDDSGTPWENSDAVLITAGNEVSGFHRFGNRCSKHTNCH